MNILFYGFRHGHIFGCYTEAKNHPDYNIVAALEENAEARSAAEAKLGITFDSGSYESWLENPMVDAVAFGGAYGDRGAAIIAALQHGKHVIADKPLCIDLAQLAQIRALAEEKHLTVGCLLDLRYTPAAVTAKKLLESGEMGKVKNISFTGQHCIDYANRPGWYFEEGMHGGTLNDLAIHAIDLVPYLTGHRIQKIHCARTWNSFATRNPDFLDSAMFMAETTQGAGVLADVSYSAPSQVFSMPTYWDFKFWCEKGLVTFCYINPDVSVYKDGAAEVEILPGVAPATSILDDFLAEIQNGTCTLTQSVLASSEDALNLQAAANKE